MDNLYFMLASLMQQQIDMTDLEDIGLRVKHMPLLKVAQGYLYKVQGEVRISLKT